tara:strand:- start:739 stop:1428 length:690 start_codon:yes stop_codon:yes gene_type:complete
MDLDQFESGTPPFITLDACDGKRAEAVLTALEAHSNGKTEEWTNLVNQDEALELRLKEQGVQMPDQRENIPWDNATVLFTSCIEVSSDGRPLIIADGVLREKIGRFPWGDGSLISYMHEFIRPNSQLQQQKAIEGYETIVNLLEVLSQRCGPSQVGHDRYQTGTAGMNIKGYLDSEQVRVLRLALSGRSWSVTADEVIDGGMRDVSRNLIAILRAAERRKVGIILRTHS